MAHTRIKSNRFAGVYWRESTAPRRRHNGRPDRCFDFCIRVGGKLKWVNVGWLSEGFSEQKAANMRHEALARLAQGEEFGANGANRLTLDVAAQEYFIWMEGEQKYAVPERSRYDVHVRPGLGHLEIAALTPALVDGLKADLLRKCSEATAKKVLSVCRAIVNHAARNGRFGGVNPFGRDRLQMPRPQNKGERFLTPQEARALLDELEKRSPQLHDMAWLSLKTGLRSTEIFRLRGADVDREGQVLWVTEKGGRRVPVRVRREILEMLAAYGRNGEEYIFQARDCGKLKQISDTFERACAAVGLQPQSAEERAKMDSRKKVWFHVLRHTFASWLAQSGTVTLQELRDIMRHHSITMTERYAHLIPGKAETKTAVIDRSLNGE